MLGPFTFTFTLESEEFEKSEKVAAAGYVIDHELYNAQNFADDINAGLGGGFSDVEACFCDTALCNSASKQTLTAIFAVFLLIHLIY